MAEVQLERMKRACTDMAYLKSGKWKAKDSIEDIKELEARTIKARNPQPKKLNSLTLAIKIGA